MSNLFADTGTGFHVYYGYKTYTVGKCSFQMHNGVTENWSFKDDGPIPEDMTPYAVSDSVPDGCASYLVNGQFWIHALDFRKLTMDQWNAIVQLTSQNALQKSITEANGQYSVQERETWSYQLSQAQMVMAGEPSNFIAEISSSRGVATNTMAQKIVDKSAAYNAAITSAIASHQKVLSTPITSIDDVPQVDIQTLIQYTAQQLSAKQ